MIYALGENGWQELGYAPVAMPVKVFSGQTEGVYLQAVPTGPGQFSQRFQLAPGPYFSDGFITVFMYNTGFGCIR